MRVYRMDDGTVVKVANATESWPDKYRWDGSNEISRATGSQWHYETLHRSRRGRYWIEHTSSMQGYMSWAEWISRERAAAWLLLNLYEIPEDLRSAAEAVEE